MTDKLSGYRLVEKTFIYLTGLTKECRKAITVKFEHEYKGLFFNSIEATLRKEVEYWFTQRDKNIKISFDKSLKGRLGEVIMIYSGENKDANFKIHVESQFTLSGSSDKAPSYLKDLNVYVDKRDFTK